MATPLKPVPDPDKPAKDPLRKTLQGVVQDKAHSRDDFLSAIIAEAALECDQLRDVREDTHGSDLKAQISTRRVQSLKFLAEMYHQKSKGKTRIDPKSPEMNLVLKSIVSLFKESLEEVEGLPVGAVKKVLLHFSERMEGWERDIQEKLEALYQMGETREGE